MTKKKNMGIMALLLPALWGFTILPVSAEITSYQEADAGLEETSAECQVIYKETYDFSEEIPKYPELEVYAFGYEGIYDGKFHGITVDSRTDGAEVLYSTDGKAYTEKKPIYTDVGTYVIFYKVEKDGYAATVGSATVKITEAAIDFASSDYNGIYDGKKHGIELSAKTDGCQILYSEDGVNYTSKKPEYKEPGTYVVYYKILKKNYATVTGSATVTITAKKDDVGSTKENNNSKGNNGNGSTDGKSGSAVSKVQTGDESNILLYGIMLAVSLSGAAKNRRKEKKKYE